MQASGASRRENSVARPLRCLTIKSETNLASSRASKDDVVSWAIAADQRQVAFARIASGVSGCASGWAFANGGSAIEVS